MLLWTTCLVYPTFHGRRDFSLWHHQEQPVILFVKTTTVRWDKFVDYIQTGQMLTLQTSGTKSCGLQSVQRTKFYTPRVTGTLKAHSPRRCSQQKIWSWYLAKLDRKFWIGCPWLCVTSCSWTNEITMISCGYSFRLNVNVLLSTVVARGSNVPIIYFGNLSEYCLV